MKKMYMGFQQLQWYLNFFLNRADSTEVGKKAAFRGKKGSISPFESIEIESENVLYSLRSMCAHPCIYSQSLCFGVLGVKTQLTKVKRSLRFYGSMYSVCNALVLTSPTSGHSCLYDEQKGSYGHSNKIGRALGRRGIALGRVDPGAVDCSKRLLRDVTMSLFYLFAYSAGVSQSLRVWIPLQGSGSTNEMGQLPSHHFGRKSSLAVMQPSS